MKKDEFILYWKRHRINKVEEGINYFLEYRFNEMSKADKYYTQGFIDYIEHLEVKIDKLTKQLKTN